MSTVLNKQLEGSLALERAKDNVVAIVPEANPMGILQLAIARDANIETLTRLMELQERWEANEARKAFNAAMAKFKANPPEITKNKHVKFNTSKGVTEYDHATLDHVVDRIGAALSAVGIAHTWKTAQDGARISVTCALTHAMGHSESVTLSAMPDDSGGKNTIQQIGSAVTYLQRYTLLAATGMAGGTDDDGQASAQMPLDDYAYHKEQIEAATTVPALQKAFATAYTAAKTSGDKGAMANITKVYNDMKAKVQR